MFCEDSLLFLGKRSKDEVNALERLQETRVAQGLAPDVQASDTDGIPLILPARALWKTPNLYRTIFAANSGSYRDPSMQIATSSFIRNSARASQSSRAV